MARLNFTKMHGLGNDYIYFNTFEQKIDDPEGVAKMLSRRHFSVGSDGIVLIMPPQKAAADFSFRMFNPDGSEAEICGNAIRCVGKLVYEKKLTTKKEICVDTKAGLKYLQLFTEHERVTGVRVDMGEPILAGKAIPVLIDKDRVIRESLKLAQREYKFTAVSMGNPHCVIFTDTITDSQVLQDGPLIEKHPLFPKRVNVEFARVRSQSEVDMRVWERGTGETLACGTGACAAAVAAVLNGLCGRKITVHLLGGDLEIEWAENNRVFKTGPATVAFEGSVEI